VLKLTPLGHRPWLSSLGYLGIGWVALVALQPLVAALPTAALVLLVAGGLSYTVGVAFYAWERLPYNHTVWHLFVLAGSTLHYLAVQLYVIG
ncbi:MAG: PAQR family membrane homeostasis protein TrhA, partial [Myxococcota bacterium]